MPLSAIFLIFLFSPFEPSADATISKAFSEFLAKTYGNESEQQIARRDLGEKGSFGGGNNRVNARKRPVIFVHGLTGTAGHLKSVMVGQFLTTGKYRISELYGTTYSNGRRNWLTDRMECRHIKQLRLLIKAVLVFTRSRQVNVIAYSMGSPIARKAILGGNCVDTGEYLGGPLTASVHTFIGVGGANRDSVHRCEQLGESGPCNMLNGFKCHSKFLDNINGKSHGYEAKSRIYVIRSTSDDIVGVWDCDHKLVSSIEGQHCEMVLQNYTHSMTLFSTGKQQLRLLGNDV